MQYHPFVNAPEDDDARCTVCGLAEHAVAHRRFLAAPYDHGSSSYRYESARFATIYEATAWASQQPSGRKTSFTGRNIEDITWYIRDLSIEDFIASIVATVSGSTILVAA